MDTDKDWILKLAGGHIERLEVENKLLREKNQRLLESLNSIKAHTETPSQSSVHNVQVAVSWVADLLKA